MTIRSRREAVHSKHSFRIRGIEAACGATEMLSIGSIDLANAQAADASIGHD
ncbi:hypothetical protein JQ581_32020 [Bradyrhizobium liaoningense]|uniref:hypothetical protein n=1 Tax=Bradyrhizobium liaoningense TaxID=43992 RepID=UPI001BAA2935|nr:hypothetical protein [Bradyrhizobium liaoningense]MBR0741570.1 hypothetical protein [Bradyrhizobium liaoningense]